MKYIKIKQIKTVEILHRMIVIKKFIIDNMGEVETY